MIDLGNCLYWLCAILCLLTIELLVLFKFDYFQPSVIFSGTMALSCFLGCIKINSWNLFVGIDTALITLFALLFFSLGSLVAHYHGTAQKSKKIIESAILGHHYVYKVVCISLIMLIFAYFSIMEAYNVSLRFGNTDGIMNMINSLRYPLERGEFNFSRWFSYRRLFAYGALVVSAYLLLKVIIFNSQNSNKMIYLLIFPVILYLPYSILSTGRRDLVHVIIMFCTMGAILYQYKYNNSTKCRVRLLLITFIALAFAIIGYFLLGHLTGKVVSASRDHFTIIAHYGGLSLPALEHYFEGPFLENGLIGQNTLMAFYGNLNTLGAKLPLGRDFLLFTKFNGIDTNVYTVLYRQITDYGVIGCYLLLFSFGIVFTYAYDYLKVNANPLGIMIYGMFSYVPFFLFIDDQFMTIFSTRNLYKVILVYLMYKLLTKKFNSES